jgi:sulfide:quinone oxidoreductase
VLVAGSGVAAVEACLALRALAGQRLPITLLTPQPQLEHRAASITAPFGLGAPPPLDLHEAARREAVTIRHGWLAEVDAAAHLVRKSDGEAVPYDVLLVAIGARANAAVPGAVTFRGPADVAELTEVLAAVERGAGRRLAFVLPPGVSWPLPLYELAIMTAIELLARGVRDAELTVVTREDEPLWLFGPAAGRAMRELLAARGIALRTGERASAFRAGRLELDGSPPLAVDQAIALPALKGARIPGLPHDDAGFIPTDSYGRVAGVEDVYAAGDATTFPVKQGGLAAQQADAAAEAIAAAAGLPLKPRPFRPVLRGLLLTGGAPLYLRATLDPQGRIEDRAHTRLVGSTSTRALWWPPAKVAGRYLAPLLATARPAALAEHPMQDLAPGGGVVSEGDDALAFALLVADRDAQLGDFDEAVQALDAAAALNGGVLPPGWDERRQRWLAATSAAAEVW